MILFNEHFLIFSSILILFSSLSIFSERKGDSAESFKPLLLLIIICGLISLSLKDNNTISTYLIAKIIFSFSFLLLFIRIYIRSKEIDYKYSFLITFCLILIFSTYYFFDLISIKYHSSPDNHGFASTVGAFLENFSYNFHAKKIILDTGLKEAVIYGQETPYYSSTWNIPDAQLRFVGDMVFTVGRIGIPLLMSLIISLFDPIYAFPTLLISLGILGSFFYGLFNIELIENIFEILFKKKLPINNFIKIILIFLFAMSPWVVVLVIEGALTQFFSILICQYLFLNVMKLLNKKNMAIDNNFIIRFLIASLSIAIIYPHASLLFLIVTFFCALLIYQKSLKDKLKISFIFSILSVLSLPAAYFILGDSFYYLLKSFLSNISGMPYNLNIIGIFELYPVIGFTLSIKERGFDILYYSKSFAFIQLLIFLFLIYFLFYKNKLISFNNLVFLILPIFFSLPLLIMFLKYDNLQPYIYLRHLCNLLIFASPILISLLFNKYSYLVKLKRITAITLCLITALNFYNLTSGYNEKSLPHNSLLIKEKFTNINSKNTLYFSDLPKHDFFSLTILGGFNYMTDNWNPHIKFNPKGNNIYEVYEIIHDNGSILEFVYHGKVKLFKDLIGPISIEDFKNNYEIY